MRNLDPKFRQCWDGESHESINVAGNSPPQGCAVSPFRLGTGITGGWIKAGQGKDKYSLGLFTTDRSAEFGNWDDGTVLVAGWRRAFAECWEMDEATVALGSGWQDLGFADEGLPILARGTGDFHESVYAGLIWMIIPKHMTMLFGLEWEQLESRDTEVYQGLTGWFSTRVIF